MKEGRKEGRGGVKQKKRKKGKKEGWHGSTYSIFLSKDSGKARITPTSI